jgi:predicted O-methyltransferase YrrM
MIKHFYNEPHMGENYFTFPAMYKAMVEAFPSDSKFVEVGVYKGMSAAFMAVEIINSGKNIKFDCVDNWSNEVYANYYDSDANVRAIFDSRDGIGDKLFETFEKNIEPVKEAINVIKANSWEAADLYEDESVDFVFIDADHSYDSVVKDLTAWFPKVKNGGILAGHDYAWHEPIRNAVNTVFGEGRYDDPWNSGCFAFGKSEGKAFHLKAQKPKNDTFVYKVML